MPYLINEVEYKTKAEITERCREIIASTEDGQAVAGVHVGFLLDLLRHHDEWQDKTAAGVLYFTAQTTLQGTRCLGIVRRDGSQIDISFMSAIRHIPTGRPKLPQKLLDYIAAARTAVEPDILKFRDCCQSDAVCPINGEAITAKSCEVDHAPPNSFQRLLYNFTTEYGVEPTSVEVGSINGTKAVFKDEELSRNWVKYHRDHCTLRLLSVAGHKLVPKESSVWTS